MCDIWKRTDSTAFTPADLELQMPDIRHLGVKWVVLTGGEPLMAPHLFALCKQLKSEGIRITLLSSGLLLQRHAAQIVQFTDEVIVSLDGPPAVHDRIRNVPGAWEQTRAGLIAIRTLNPAFPLAARCTVQRANHSALLDTVPFARELPLDSISFLAADTQSEAFDHHFPQTDSIALRSEELPTLDQQLNSLADTGLCGTFIRETPAKLNRIARHFRAQLGLVEAIAPICNAPWHSAVVETDGTVRPCFFHQPIGRITPHQNLAAILEGPAARTFRSSLDVESNPVCQRCVCSLNWQSSEASATSPD